jgi:hypothetical protein
MVCVFYEEMAPSNSKLPVPKNQHLTVTAGSHVADDIEQDVFDMIKNSYAKIGGHAKIQKPSDVSDEYPVWTVADTDDDPEPDVVQVTSHSYETGGLKGGASATDGSPVAKSELMNILKNFYSTPGNWSEVSGAMAHILIKKLGVPVVTDPNKIAKLLDWRPYRWMGKNPDGDSMGHEGWYVRQIGAAKHAKIIVGNV